MSKIAEIHQTWDQLVHLPARIRDLEAAVQENRRLNRRVAELTDVVAELLLPVADRDEEKVHELLARYRDGSFQRGG